MLKISQWHSLNICQQNRANWNRPGNSNEKRYDSMMSEFMKSGFKLLVQLHNKPEWETKENLLHGEFTNGSNLAYIINPVLICIYFPCSESFLQPCIWSYRVEAGTTAYAFASMHRTSGIYGEGPSWRSTRQMVPRRHRAGQGRSPEVICEEQPGSQGREPQAWPSLAPLGTPSTQSLPTPKSSSHIHQKDS